MYCQYFCSEKMVKLRVSIHAIGKKQRCTLYVIVIKVRRKKDTCPNYLDSRVFNE